MFQEFVFINGPRGNQPLTAELLERFLVALVEIVYLDRQFPPHEVEKKLGHSDARFGTSTCHGRVAISPEVSARQMSSRYGYWISTSPHCSRFGDIIRQPRFKSRYSRYPMTCRKARCVSASA